MSDHALICCAVRTRRGDSRDQRTEMGLVRKNSKAGENAFLKLENVSTPHQVKNHAYGVTGVRRVAVGSGINAVLRREKLALVRRK